MLTELLTFCHKSSTNISIDNRYYNRFIQLGRPIFPMKYNGAALFTIPTTFGIAHAHVTLARHQSANLRPELDHRYTTARCFYCSVNPSRLQWLYLRPVPRVCWYRLNCNRLNDHERLIIFSVSATSPAPPAILPFLLVGCCDCRWLRNAFSIPRAPDNMSHKTSLQFISTFGRNTTLSLECLGPVAVFQ